MADKAREWTDKKLEEMEKHLFAIYNRATKEIGKSWKDYLIESGQEIKALQSEYDKAKKSGNQDEVKKVGRKLAKAKRDKTVMNDRFKDVSETLARELYDVNKTAVAYVNGELPEIYAVNYNALEPAVDGIGGYSFSLVDAETVKNLATTDDSLLPYRELDLAKDVRWNMNRINAETLQGILIGESMDKIAQRISNVEEMNRNTAIRTARTIVTSAENKGRQNSYERATKDGIILQREWLAVDDKRTRDWHAELDGVLVDVNKPFENAVGEIMYPGDPLAHPSNIWNCRCSMAAKVMGFRKVRK